MSLINALKGHILGLNAGIEFEVGSAVGGMLEFYVRGRQDFKNFETALELHNAEQEVLECPAAEVEV